jgi:transposase InsO family protein
VKLYLEEGFTLRMIGEQLGVSRDTICDWVQRYRERGRAGLEPLPSRPGPRKTKLPAAVHEQIVQVKKEHPGFGIRRIAQWLRRTLLIPASAETVRQTLHRHGELPKTKPRKGPRNPPKPRFFERATPMQMWQSDICTVRLLGKNAYLIGFMDDHSRYLVGFEVYRSQTCENVLEVYRRAVGEYGVPKEMLTDNGRQYAAWRGTTRFQQELQKDRVHHIRSQPHHPQTLGKIERFWKTIWDEFLGRAQFETFESARERIRLWVKYYNHKRTHQSLDGLCPADRFFAIQKPLRDALERGMQENLLELALRGQPKSPFYMVGRMGGQSVVMKVEEGQIKMVVDGQEDRPVREVNYAIQGTGHEQSNGQGEERTDRAQRPGEVSGGALPVDGPAAALGDLPGDGGAVEPAEQLAGAGDGGHAGGVGAADAPAGGPGADAGAEDGTAAGAEDGAAGNSACTVGGEEPACGREDAGEGVVPAAERTHEETARGRADEGDAGGLGGAPDGEGRGGIPGDLPQELLPMGGPCVGRDAGLVAAGPARPAPEGSRSAEDASGGGSPAVAGRGADHGATGPDPEPVG